jgi:hypothetical protein
VRTAYLISAFIKDKKIIVPTEASTFGPSYLAARFRPLEVGAIVTKHDECGTGFGNEGQAECSTSRRLMVKPESLKEK